MASVKSSPVTNTDKSRARSLYLTQNSAADRQNGNQMIDNSRWRSDTEQQNYSSKLLQALRHVPTTTPPPSASSSVPRRGRAIRKAADRALAVAAKGRTRWSRATLSNKMKLKFLNQAKKPKVVSPIAGRTRKLHRASVVRRLKAKNIVLPAVQHKALVLGNLVPGCRKQPLSVVLEEAHDYISALDELLSVAGACWSW